MEDALKRLDKLTHDETRMAIAENLRATHAIDDGVKGVVDKVLDVDARVVNGVQAVIAGAQTVTSLGPKFDEPLCPRWKRDQGSCPTSSQRCRPSKTFVVP